MPNEIYILLGAVVGAVAAYITSKLTNGTQLRLQNDRMADERLKSEVAIERAKLEALHLILSKILMENSQTMSFIQSDAGTTLSEFRGRYLANCERLHQAHAIADIYYPEMSKLILEIYGQTNMFWGYQEGVMRINVQENERGWNSNLAKVLEAGKEITNRVRNLQRKIAERGSELNKALHRTSR